MQERAGKITYGAMMIALFTILLLMTLYLPVIGIVTMFFVPLPIILYRLRFDRSSSILIVVGSVLLTSIIGGILVIPIALTFAPMGFLIGDTIREEKSKLYTFMASGLWMLITIVATYALSVLLFGINMIEEMLETLQVSQEKMTELLVTLGETPENFEKQMADLISFYEIAMPSVFIIASFIFAFIIIVVNMGILKRMGYKIVNFAPFRMMKLPTLTVWIYFIVMILPFLTTIEPSSMTELIYVNATTIFRMLFFLQGLSFVLYYLTETKMPKVVTVIAIIITILLSPITTLLGILDAGMNLRNFVGRNKSN